ncbi:MAG: hypothetical protein AB7I19_06770 [Planctomycetota bacterium]
MSRIIVALLPLLLLSSLLPTPVSAQEAAVKAEPAAAAAVQVALPAQVQSYPLDTCVVSDEPLDEDAVTFAVDGRTLRTCCAKCKAKVEKEPAPFLAKLDAAIIARQKSSYPLTTCVVSGKPLGSMGEPVTHLFDGVLVQLCCKGCNKKAIAASSEMRRKVMEGHYATQSASYSLTVCPISGEELGDDFVERFLDTRLVRFCCNNCAKKLLDKSSAVLAQLDAAARERAEASGEDSGTDDAAAKPADGKSPKKSSTPAKSAEKKGQAAAAGCACCGDACVEGATGGCCKDAAGGGAKPATGGKPAKQAAGATECCESAPAPVNPPKKVN